MKNPIITVNNIFLHHKIEKYYTKKLENINLSFEPGKFYAIIGPLKSGKSTLLSLIGLIEIINGEKYCFQKNDISNLNDEELAKIRNKYYGYTYSYGYFDKNLTILDNLLIPLLPNKEEKNKKKIVLDTLKKYNLENFANKFLNKISKYDLQLISLARALINNPDIIIADEPTLGLTKEEEKMILIKYKELSKKGKCIIMAYESKSILDYADEIIDLESI